MKEEIFSYLVDKDKVSIKDIYQLLPLESKPRIRSTLNELVNHNLIKRLERGYYSSVQNVPINLSTLETKK